MPSPSASSRNAFGALLGRAYRQWRRAADLRLQPYNLTEATWLPLLRIARAPAPPRQKDLAAAMFVDNSSVVRLLDNLEEGGLIQRKEGETDRRAKTIHLTARGRAIADKAETMARRVRQDALAGLPEKDIDAAIRVLEHICRALDTDLEAAAA
jgi:MarR family transcriptional regulator for hemolysin